MAVNEGCFLGKDMIFASRTAHKSLARGSRLAYVTHSVGDNEPQTLAVSPCLFVQINAIQFGKLGGE